MSLPGSAHAFEATPADPPGPATGALRRPSAPSRSMQMETSVSPSSHSGRTAIDGDSPLKTVSRRLYAFVDWFIPPDLRANADVVQGVRMFLFSHIFGPFLGHTISFCILIVQGQADLAWWVFFGAVTLFWPYTIALRLTGLYVPLALMSIENLIFCILWGCYHYGGISSPILPWMITVPLLAFFYLPTSRTRIIVSLLIVANLIAFFVIYDYLGFPDTFAPTDLVGLGIVSTFCAGVYVSMMALYFSNIVSSQSELELEVRRHEATERQLREATEQVERATRAKSEFLAKMSHELRNPLNAIIGYSEMLLEFSPAEDPRCADLNSIKGAGYTLLSLVNDLLDLSKLEAGKMQILPKQVSFPAFMSEVESRWMERVARDGGNTLRVDCPADLDDIVVDAGKLRQAIDNVILNAMKSAKDGQIVVTASIEADFAVVSVRDTGPALSPDRLEDLFETFGSQENETSSNYREDPGLGLPLSRRLCRLMGGDIIAESQPGAGSCFTLRVPSDFAARDDDNAVKTIGQRSGRKPVKQPILVIDDDPAVLDLLARILAKEGFTPVLSATGEDGLARAREIKPPIIILDVRLAESDTGWHVLREIREDPDLLSCRVILLTVDDDFARGVALGADAHLLKPVARDVLLRSIEKVRVEAPLVPDDRSLDAAVRGREPIAVRA